MPCLSLTGLVLAVVTAPLGLVYGWQLVTRLQRLLDASDVTRDMPSFALVAKGAYDAACSASFDSTEIS